MSIIFQQNKDKLKILNNLLEKTFSTSLNNLEKRTQDHINSLKMTDKQFKNFNQIIQNLKTLQKENPQKKKSENKDKAQLMNQSKLISRSKTTVSIHKTKNQNKNNKNTTNNNTRNNSVISNNISLNTSLRSSINKQYFSNTNTIISKRNNNINSRNSVNDNSNKLKKNDLRSKSLHNTRYFDTSIIERNNTYKKRLKSIKNEIESPKNLNKSTRETLDFQFEISNIQEQIKHVEDTIINTEKITINHKKTKSPERKIKFKINLNQFFENNYSLIINNIIIFCDLEDGINLLSFNKKYCKEERIKYFNKLIEKINEKNIEKAIEEIKEKNLEELNNSYPQFQLTKSSLRAIEALNEELYLKIFYYDVLPEKYNEILIIYKLFVQLIKDENLIKCNNNNIEFWREISNYFMIEGKNKLGTFINNLTYKFSFDEENIIKIRHLINKYKNKISPSYYSKICGTTGLIVFILKDALEYCGIIINEKKTPIKRIYENLFREKENLNKLIQIKENLQNM